MKKDKELEKLNKLLMTQYKEFWKSFLMWSLFEHEEKLLKIATIDLLGEEKEEKCQE